MAVMTQDDRLAIRDYCDEVGDVERNRLRRDLPGRVSFEVHLRKAAVERDGPLDVCHTSRFADVNRLSPW
jgi:hypothetical protein